MMKKLFKGSLLAIFCLCSMMASGQDDDDIQYYTDSEVKYSRFKMALLLNPNYTDMRLINNEIPIGGEFDLHTDQADGSFQLNYYLDLIYSIGTSFDISIGVGFAGADYGVGDLTLFEDSLGLNVSDTVNAGMDVEVSMVSIPFKLNFNTTVGDLVDLEVVPTVELVFVNKYDQTFHPQGGQSFNIDRSEQTQSINYNVGISLGGTYHLTDNLGLVVRANIKYMLNPLIEMPDYPRETLYSYGGNIGLSYKF